MRVRRLLPSRLLLRQRLPFRDEASGGAEEPGLGFETGTGGSSSGPHAGRARSAAPSPPRGCRSPAAAVPARRAGTWQTKRGRPRRPCSVGSKGSAAPGPARPRDHPTDGATPPLGARRPLPPHRLLPGPEPQPHEPPPRAPRPGPAAARAAPSAATGGPGAQAAPGRPSRGGGPRSPRRASRSPPARPHGAGPGALRLLRGPGRGAAAA